VVLYVAIGGLVVLVGAAYWLETRHALGTRGGSLALAQAPRGRRVRHASIWSALWLALGLVPTALFGLLHSSGSASAYAAVYLIERSLSLDNVFVFAVLIATFEIPAAERDTLISWGAFAAFALRVPAIVVGVALFEASHVVGYALGALLLVLAWHTARGGGEQQGGSIVSFLRRRLPVGEHAGRRLLVLRDGRAQLTPMLLCLIAIMLADVTFAVDSIPAALAISHDTTRCSRATCSR
jgi:TerC family integral membrane protein